MDKKWKKILKAIIVWFCLVLVLVVGAYAFHRTLLPTIHFAVTTPAEKLEFPVLTEDSISEDVKNLLLRAKNEYENPKSGEFYA